MTAADLYYTTTGPGASATNPTWTKVVSESPVAGTMVKKLSSVIVDRHQMSRGCDLCEAAVITTRYFEDDDCWIADCEICLVPMVVWRTPRRRRRRRT